MDDRCVLILLGGGGHAAVVAEAALAAGMSIAGFLDDEPGRSEMAGMNVQRLGSIGEARAVLARQPGQVALHAAVGDGTLRRSWMTSVDDCPFATVAHPSSVISPTATVGRGVFLAPRCVANARATIADGAIINTGAIVEHDCRIGPFSHIAPGSVLAGEVSVGHDSLIGAGAVVLPGVRVGCGVVVGAGAVVVSDIDDGARVAGVPARPIPHVASR